MEKRAEARLQSDGAIKCKVESERGQEEGYIHNISLLKLRPAGTPSLLRTRPITTVSCLARSMRKSKTSSVV